MKSDLSLFLEVMGFIAIPTFIFTVGFCFGYFDLANKMTDKYTKVPYCTSDNKCFKVIEVKP